MGPDPPEFTDDGFLGGRLVIRQPAHGYRAGVDPVLLAAAVPAQTGESVLELGCGVGTACLCLGARVPGLRLTGIELQADYAQFARHNAELNTIPLDVVTGDLCAMPQDLRAQSFDHVLMNPPYFDRDARTAAEDPGRETALSETDPLTNWCDAGLRRLKPGGALSVIHVPDRLPHLLTALAPRSSVTIHPLAPRRGKPAHRIILVARKGGRAGVTLAAPNVLHAGDAHQIDGENYRAEIRQILRDGAPWPWNTR